VRDTTISPDPRVTHDARGDVRSDAGDVLAGKLDFTGVQPGAGFAPELVNIGGFRDGIDTGATASGMIRV
jgi:hypothetical protein